MRKITLILLLLLGCCAQAQILVNNTHTPAWLVQNVLVGQGVTPTNIIFNGTAPNANTLRDQCALFDTNFNPSNLPVDKGLILTTGKSIVALGPNDSGSKSNATGNPIYSDADLGTLTTNTVENSAVLEFDFVATGLELNFEFVFASEEYPEFVGSGFNDVFGFFLTGPGNPVAYNSTNIALIPNTNIPITINNLNNGSGNTGPCSYCQYYINNGTGSSPANTTVQYDGFTKLLSAKADLICGQTYHIKLAVGNVGDNAYDSAVFLKNFRIKPLVLLDDLNLDENTTICNGNTVTIDSGLLQNTTAPYNTFEWYRDGVRITEELGGPPVTTPINTPTLTLTPQTLPANPFGLTETPASYKLIVKTSYGCTIAKDSISLGYLPEIPIEVPKPITKVKCGPAAASYVFDLNAETDLILGPANVPLYVISYYDNAIDASFGAPTGRIDDADLATYTITTATASVWIRIESTLSGTDCARIEEVALSSVLAPSGTISYPQSTYCGGINTLQQVTSTATAGGVFSATPAGLNIDAVSGAINPSLSTPNNYTVHYDIAATADCPAFSPPTVSVQILAVPVAPVPTSPAPYCANSAAVALTASGTGLLWYTAATGGTGSAVAPTPDTTVLGNTTYYVSQTVGGCESPRASIVVTINAVPSAPVVTAAVTYCQNAAPTVLAATGSNLKWYTVANGGVGSAIAPTPSTLTAAITNYYVSQTVSGCESLRSLINVTVYATPALPTITTPVNYCQNASAVPLNATGTGLLWYNTATGGTGNALIPTPITTAAGTTYYYVSQTINGCEGPRAAIAVTVTATPSAPSVSTPITYCQYVTPAVLTATGSNLSWYTVATGGIGNSTAPTPDTTTVGSTTYYVSQSINGCEGARSAIVVAVLLSPAAPVTAPLSYCQNTAAVPLTAVGNSLRWYGTATGGPGSATPPTPNTTTAGSTTYYVTQTINGCESLRSALDVTVIAAPLLPLVTAMIGYCQNATANPLTAAGSNLLWYTAATGGVGNSVAPIPNTASVGMTTYYVSQTVNGCEGPRAAILVGITLVPLAPAVVTPVTYCQDAAAIALTASGANLLWYMTAVGGIGSSLPPTPDTTIPGSTTYYVSQNTGCESARSAIVVDVLPAPLVPTVSPLTYCQSAAAIPLTAIGTNLKWYAAATGGIGNSIAPTPNTATAGITTYYVSQAVNGCEGPRASITVTVYATPALPTVTSPVGYCQDAIANPLTASGTNLLWYTTAAGGIGNAIIPTPSTAVPGTTTYYVSQTTNGCEGPRRAIVVNVTPTPSAPLVTSSVTYCQNSAATVLSASGTNLLWYTNPLSGSGSTTAPVPNTNVAGTTAYYVSQTINSCESARETILVNVLPSPAAPTVTALTYCQNTAATALTAIGSNLLWYTTVSGGAGNASPPIPNTASAATTTYYVSQTVNGCEGARAAISVTVYATPILPAVTSPIGYCQNTTAIPLTATGSGLLWYGSLTGGTGNAVAPTPSTATIGSTTYYVSQTINGCEGPRAAIVVNVSLTPSAPAVITPIVYCQNASPAALTASGTNLRWYTSASGGPGSITPPIVGTTSPGDTIYYVSQSNNSCESVRAAITVTVLPLPLAPITSGISYCQNTSASALTATGTGLLWYSNATGGTGNTTAPIPNTTIAGVKNYYVSQTINGCEGPRASLAVTIYATPSLPIVASPVAYCQNTTAVVLTATGSNLLWYTASSGGTGNATAPTPSTINSGNTNYYVSQTINGCEGPRATIAVSVNPAPSAPVVSTPIVYCQGQSAAVLTATGSNLLWYSNAAGGTGSATAPTPSTVSAGNSSYYVTQTTNGCESLRSIVTVKVNEVPKPSLENGSICVDENNTSINSVTFDSGLELGTYNFEWFDLNAGSLTPIIGANQPTYMTNVPGAYGVRAINALTGCTSEVVMAQADVLPTPYQINVSASEYFEDDQRITINILPAGNYQYQLDNGAMQTENVFVDVTPGPHTVHIKSECQQFERSVYLMDFPRFFTPNGDGYNDLWNIFSLSGQAKAKIYIFDRFGKLLKEISPSGIGWDGTYNQQKVPASDYWFIVHYDDQNKVSKVFKSHFALKR